VSAAGARHRADQIGPTPREVLLQPAGPARAAIARDLGLVDLPELSCRFSLRAEPAGAVIAHGTLDAVVVQNDVTTLEPFAAPVREVFVVRFVPEHQLTDMLDPDDPVDEIGITGGMIDLEAAMCEQLALALDPYPRRKEAAH
jgi:uncharacterized metal-binding protein YceD (DUF177 family)